MQNMQISGVPARESNQKKKKLDTKVVEKGGVRE